MVVSPTSNVTSPSRIQKPSSSRWCTWSGASRPGASVISTIASRPPVSAAVALSTARLPSHQRASPPPLGTATGASGCGVGGAGARLVSCVVWVMWVMVSLLAGLVETQERDDVPPGAVAPAAHHVGAPPPHHQGGV